MTAKFTPVPWNVEFKQLDIGTTFQDRRVFFSINGGACSLEVAQGDRNLIGSAPELLASVKGLLWAVENGDDNELLAARSFGRAVIAKAEGGKHEYTHEKADG